MKYWYLVGLMFLISCGARKTNQSFWDDTTGTYIMPSLELSYTVPTDVGNWAIAEMDGSVPEIKFCGVDTSTDICIVIVEPDSGLRSVSELDSVKVKDILREIICQSPTGHILQFCPKMERGLYAGSGSWDFRTDISIVSLRDTVDVSYTGHIFDCPNRKVAGIVSIVPTEILDSVGLQTMYRYFDGVSRIANN
ncbi:MAG: hypothetical protein J1D86_03815 [Alistipes sp.]|nr:hypothetical protein [Alistipes sp.]